MQISDQINIAMTKMVKTSLTAYMLSRNEETLYQFVASDKAFTFVNTIKKAPAYWRKFFLEVLPMIKELGLSTFFLTFSCADLGWNEHISIISKLESNVLSEYKI